MVTLFYTLWILYTAGTLSLILFIISFSLYTHFLRQKARKELLKKAQESRNTSSNLSEESW